MRVQDAHKPLWTEGSPRGLQTIPSTNASSTHSSNIKQHDNSFIHQQARGNAIFPLPLLLHRSYQSVKLVYSSPDYSLSSECSIQLQQELLHGSQVETSQLHCQKHIPPMGNSVLGPVHFLTEQNVQYPALGGPRSGFQGRCTPISLTKTLTVDFPAHPTLPCSPEEDPAGWSDGYPDHTKKVQTVLVSQSSSNVSTTIHCHLILPRSSDPKQG